MKTYICHYPKLKERIDYLIPDLNNKGLKEIEVINGIDRTNVNESHLLKFSNDINLVRDRLNYTNCPPNYDILKESEKVIVANFLTHLEIWERISKSDENYCLVEYYLSIHLQDAYQQVLLHFCFQDTVQQKLIPLLQHQ